MVLNPSKIRPNFRMEIKKKLSHQVSAVRAANPPYSGDFPAAAGDPKKKFELKRHKFSYFLLKRCEKVSHVAHTLTGAYIRPGTHTLTFSEFM